MLSLREFFGSLREDGRAFLTSSAWGFSPHEYVQLSRKYPQMLKNRLLKIKTAEQMGEEAEHKGSLKRTLDSLGLTCVGVGLMLGAGIFIAPGEIAVDYTGAAVCIAYVLAAVSAFLSCFCYSEFAVDMPLAGAAYNYIASSLGEFLAWIVTSNLLFEYILADAAVIRGFAPYFAVLINKDTDFFLYEHTMMGKTYTFDWFAFGLTLVMTAILARGAKESTTANTIITIIHVVVLLFIIIAGFTQANPDNMRPFFPPNEPGQPAAWKQIFNGACVAFFSFIGFDAVATAAEEVIDPPKMMPIGILGSMSIVTVIYVLMCVVLTLMVPVDMISKNATFAVAFEAVGLGWAKYIVAIGALLGIITGTLMGIYAPARILTGCCREGMLPPFMSWVGPKQTPWVATWIIGICVAVIALMTDFDELSSMVSIGTLLVFWFVAVALIWRRMHRPGKTSPLRVANQLLHIFAMIGFSLGFTLVWTLPLYNTVDGAKGAWADVQDQMLILMAVLAFAVPVSMFFFCKPTYVPAGYKVPLFPLIPCASIFVNTFLLGQLEPKSYQRFGWWSLGVTVLYLLYGIFASQNKDDHSSIEASIKADPSHNDFEVKPVADSMVIKVPVAVPVAARVQPSGEFVEIALTPADPR